MDVFTDAEEALDAFLASPTRWQLALVDGTMPKYKGTALIQRMRSENPNLAAILMTGFVEQDAVQMQQEGLIDEIFLKPLDYRKLTEKIGKLLAGERFNHCLIFCDFLFINFWYAGFVELVRSGRNTRTPNDYRFSFH